MYEVRCIVAGPWPNKSRYAATGAPRKTPHWRGCACCCRVCRLLVAVLLFCWLLALALVLLFGPVRNLEDHALQAGRECPQELINFLGDQLHRACEDVPTMDSTAAAYRLLSLQLFWVFLLLLLTVLVSYRWFCFLLLLRLGAGPRLATPA